jgi:hypothetical protein
MSAPFFITESWLAENAVLTAGGEVRLPANSRLTPAARDVLNGLKIRIRYADEAGRVFVDAPGLNAEGEENRQRVHPLTSSASHETAHCQLCQQAVAKKSEALTHLNATTFVAKNDPRIAFRGRIDTAIAQAVSVAGRMEGGSACRCIATHAGRRARRAGQRVARRGAGRGDDADRRRRVRRNADPRAFAQSAQALSATTTSSRRSSTVWRSPG